ASVRLSLAQCSPPGTTSFPTCQRSRPESGASDCLAWTVLVPASPAMVLATSPAHPARARALHPAPPAMVVRAYPAVAAMDVATSPTPWRCAAAVPPKGTGRYAPSGLQLTRVDALQTSPSACARTMAFHCRPRLNGRQAPTSPTPSRARIVSM